MEACFYSEVTDIWATTFAADRPHLLPYLGQFAGASGFYAYSGDVVAAGGEARPLPWRLMGLNSNLWYKSNSYTQDMADPADHFRQDRGTLIPQMLDLKN